MSSKFSSHNLSFGKKIIDKKDSVPHKNSFVDISSEFGEREQLLNLNDTFDLQVPQQYKVQKLKTFNKKKMSKKRKHQISDEKQPKIKNALTKCSNYEKTLMKAFHEQMLIDNFNPEDMETAIALSRSINENSEKSADFPDTQERMCNIKQTLEQFGFRNTRKPVNNTTKHDKYLLLHRNIDRQKVIIENNIDRILKSNMYHTHVSDSINFEIVSSVLGNVLKKDAYLYEMNAYQNNHNYFINLIDIVDNDCMKLLKNWTNIPGRNEQITKNYSTFLNDIENPVVEIEMDRKDIIIDYSTDVTNTVEELRNKYCKTPDLFSDVESEHIIEDIEVMSDDYKSDKTCNSLDIRANRNILYGMKACEDNISKYCLDRFFEDLITYGISKDLPKNNQINIYNDGNIEPATPNLDINKHGNSRFEKQTHEIMKEFVVTISSKEKSMCDKISLFSKDREAFRYQDTFKKKSISHLKKSQDKRNFYSNKRNLINSLAETKNEYDKSLSLKQNKNFEEFSDESNSSIKITLDGSSVSSSALEIKQHIGNMYQNKDTLIQENDLLSQTSNKLLNISNINVSKKDKDISSKYKIDKRVKNSIDSDMNDYNLQISEEDMFCIDDNSRKSEAIDKNINHDNYASMKQSIYESIYETNDRNDFCKKDNTAINNTQMPIENVNQSTCHSPECTKYPALASDGSVLLISDDEITYLLNAPLEEKINSSNSDNTSHQSISYNLKCEISNYSSIDINMPITGDILIFHQIFEL